MPNKTKYIIKKTQLHIINEVRKYAKQKKILEKLSSTYIHMEDELTLQNKSMDELLVIWHKSVNALHNYGEQARIIGEYVRLLSNIIKKKYDAECYDEDDVVITKLINNRHLKCKKV